MSSPAEIHPHTLQRFIHIETQLYWGDGLTASELAKTFAIKRQTAQGVIDAYRTLHPAQMRYDRRKKRQVATADFSPHYISSQARPFLDYLRAEGLRHYYLSTGEAEVASLAVEDVDRLLSPRLNYEVVRLVVSALRHRQTLLIDYRPRAEDPLTVRVISPNHLIYADQRYHLFAYCHTEKRHLDFALARILYAEVANEEWVSSADSEEWKEDITLYFQPNPALPQRVQETMLRGFIGSEKGIRQVYCRHRAFAFYIRQRILASRDQNHQPTWVEVTAEEAKS